MKSRVRRRRKRRRVKRRKRRLQREEKGKEEEEEEEEGLELRREEVLSVHKKRTRSSLSKARKEEVVSVETCAEKVFVPVE